MFACVKQQFLAITSVRVRTLELYKNCPKYQLIFIASLLTTVG